uniref:Reverse transcriptase/retrotransposon-derived protein RNase H-like domain-containing protein n=1 Tax=Tanacetum cinerariifolium TaxID=118510 RepID=A0A6L2K005_TANCI|nr:hypothetical protein [Tanacetum cinerariifolium]
MTTREEAKSPVTKNVNSIYLARGEEERDDDNDAATGDDIEKPTGTKTGMPVKEAEKENKAENGIKTNQSEKLEKKKRPRHPALSPMGCKIWSTCPFSVSVAGGREMVTVSECKDFQWQLYRKTLTTDVMLLPLGECDMALDARKQIEWLETTKKAELMMMSIYPNTGLQLMTMEETVQAKARVEPSLQKVIDKYAEVFEVPNKLPPARSPDHIIPLLHGTLPINIRPYRHPPVQKDVIDAMIKELLKSGVIKYSQSSFASPIVMLDLRSGYSQIKMYEDDIAKKTFKTHEAIMSSCKSLEDHVQHLIAVLSKMKDHNLYAKGSKCVFGTTHVEYLRHVISAEGVATDPSKAQAMQTWPIPTTLKQLRGFFGLTGYYRRFIKNFDSISRPLTQLLKKNSFKWNGEAHESFLLLKEAMVQAPVLGLPNFHKPFIMETDASGVGLGAVLQQDGHPIAYLSKALAPKHHSLSTYEKGIVDSWTKDYHLKFIIADLKRGVARKHYVLNNNQLLRKGKLAGSTKQVKQWIKECLVCQRCKPGLSTYPRLLQPLPIPKIVWFSISMDFIEGLPKLHGCTVIFVVVDRLTKYGHFIPLSHPFTALQVAQVFLDQVFKLHGVPESIVSDRDKDEHQSKGTTILPELNKEGLLEATPVKLLDMKIVKKNNVLAMYGLVQWSNGNPQDATWELLEDIYKKYPFFDS